MVDAKDIAHFLKELRDDIDSVAQKLKDHMSSTHETVAKKKKRKAAPEPEDDEDE